MKRILLILMTVLLSWPMLKAAPAYNRPITITQADGSTITVYLKGDERIHWIESLDGYTLVKKDNQCYYAVLDADGNLVASEVKAHDVAERGEAELMLLQSVEKGLRYSPAQVSSRLEKWQVPVRKHSPAMKAAKDSTGSQDTVTMRIPVILVEYSDVRMTTPKECFDSLITMVGYKGHGCAGSFVDYFLANSRGKFRYIPDVYGPVTLPNTRAYYGGNDSEGTEVHATDMIEEACIMADSLFGADFSKYDSDGDGAVDGMHIIFAGQGEEVTLDYDAIWSHQGYLDRGVTLDGVDLWMYACSGEISAWGDFAYVSTLVHEMSHVMKVPDLYDVDGQRGGVAVDPGQFDVMAYGIYNNEGKTPPLHNAWVRASLGWLDQVDLEEPRTIEMKNAEEATQAFFVQTPAEGEYFVLDYRGTESVWDTAIPGNGLLIFAVNENVPYFGYDYNGTNNDAQNRGFYIKQADGGSSSTAAMGPDTPYPGDSISNTEFTDMSVPNSRTTMGAWTNKPITEIAWNDNFEGITFLFMGGSGDTVYDNQGNVYFVPEEGPDTTAVERVVEFRSLTLVPNPASDYFSVRAPESLASLAVYDLQGSTVRRMDAAGYDEVRVNVADLSEGVYIVVAVNREGNRVYRAKLMKR